MKKFWIVILVLMVMGFGALGTAWWFLRSLDTDVVMGGDGNVLYWVVDHDYPESRREGALARLMQGEGPVQHEMVLALRRAAADRGVDGLFLEIRALPTSWAQMQELRDAVAFFRASGKPVHAWLAAGGNAEYQLALAADAVTLAPEGMLMLPGVSATLTYVAGSLDKLGMQADYVHVGRYKSAPETYERTGPSEASREMLDAILDGTYADLVDAASAARSLDPAAVRALFDRGLFDAASALAAGLVDRVDYLPDALDAAFPQGETRDLDDYAWLGGRKRGPEVTVVTVAGTIVDGESSDGGWSGGPNAGSITVVDQLQDCYDDEHVAAVILRVDSPGGSALASDLIWNEVRALREVKPVVVSMGGMAASGGYYVACAADSVFALPGTLTGSIGVFAGKMAREEFFGRIGVTREALTRGENARLFDDHAPFTPDQRRLLQAQLDAFYDRFVEKVATGRRLEKARAEAAAQGRVWTGRDALAAGLVDGLGGLPRAMASVRAMLGLPPDAPLHLTTFEDERTLLEKVVLRSLESRAPAVTAGAVTAGAVPPSLVREAAAAAAWTELLDGRPLALSPVRVELR